MVAGLCCVIDLEEADTCKCNSTILEHLSYKLNSILCKFVEFLDAPNIAN